MSYLVLNGLKNVSTSSFLSACLSKSGRVVVRVQLLFTFVFLSSSFGNLMVSFRQQVVAVVNNNNKG